MIALASLCLARTTAVRTAMRTAPALIEPLGARCMAKKAKSGKPKGKGQEKKKKGKNTGGGVAGDFVFSMQDVEKVLPGGRQLFKNVFLQFLRGAKIGVLGLNGSGKSSLLKIMAGLDTEYGGTLWTKDGVKVIYLQQEPTLDPTKNVLENVKDGLRDKLDLLEEYERLSTALGDPDADFDTLLEEQAEVSHSPQPPAPQSSTSHINGALSASRRCRQRSTRWTAGTWDAASGRYH